MFPHTLVVMIMFGGGYDHVWIGDFLKYESKRHFDIIVTNPPYNIAQQVIQKSIDISKAQRSPAIIIMLLRINFLGSQKRYAWWQGNEPDEMLALSVRPDFTGYGGDATEYAFYIWNVPPGERKPIRVI